jgi:branched-chain amino acid transport system substrate-binding protein
MDPMRKTLVAVTSALVLAGCASSGGAGEADKSGTVKIGVVANLTGGFSPYDLPAYQGLKMAVQDLNDQGGIDGKQIELVVFDQKSKPSLGQTGARQVIEQGASVVVAPCDFDYGAAAALAAQAAEVPAMSTCAGDAAFGVNGIGPYGYSMAVPNNWEGAAFAEFMFEQQKWSRAYFLVDTTISYTKGWGEAAMKRYAELGGEVVGHDTMQNSDPSVAAQISRFKSLEPQPDVFVVDSFAPGVTAAVKQIRDAGITVPIAGAAGMDGDFWTKGIPNLGEVYHSAQCGYVAGPGTGETDEQWALAQKYEQEYDEKPINGQFLCGYAVIQAYAEAMKVAGTTTDGVKINEALQNLSDVPSAAGTFSFKPDNHAPQRAVSIAKFENGKEEFVANWTPESVPPAAVG